MPKHGVLTDTTKWCNRCQVHKLHEEFHKSKYTTSKLSVFCAICMRKGQDKWRRKNLDKAAGYQREARKKDPDRFYDYGRKSAYGLQPGEYKKILNIQKGCCAICSSNSSNGKGKNFHVDHCHITRRVRGLLCHHCNLGLGHFKSSPVLLTTAIQYLAESSCEVRR